MSFLSLRTAPALALCTVMAGCVTAPAEPTTQQLEIHTILDHREVTGVGCVLSNAAGRWFVVAPGRVTVERSRSPLAIDCAREGAGSAQDVAPAHKTSLFDTGRLIGSIIVGVGAGTHADPYDGSGVAYASTLTVIMHPTSPSGAAPAPDGGNVVF
jgi:glycerol dehydrogenase-like iron-containing ADH family enzyme